MRRPRHRLPNALADHRWAEVLGVPPPSHLDAQCPDPVLPLLLAPHDPHRLLGSVDTPMPYFPLPSSSPDDVAPAEVDVADEPVLVLQPHLQVERREAELDQDGPRPGLAGVRGPTVGIGNAPLTIRAPARCGSA